MEKKDIILEEKELDYSKEFPIPLLELDDDEEQDKYLISHTTEHLIECHTFWKEEARKELLETSDEIKELVSVDRLLKGNIKDIKEYYTELKRLYNIVEDNEMVEGIGDIQFYVEEMLSSFRNVVTYLKSVNAWWANNHECLGARERSNLKWNIGEAFEYYNNWFFNK